MAIPGSGPLRLRADINQEINGNDTDTNVSLGQLADDAGFDAPDTMSEFYGYSSVTTPTVTTEATTAITPGSLQCNGNISADGGATVTSRGFYFGTNADYTQNTKDTSGAGTGAFNKAESSLTPGQIYYITAFAINSVGEARGSTISTQTTACSIVPVGHNSINIMSASTSSSIFFRLRYTETSLVTACQPTSWGVYLGTSSTYTNNTKYTLGTGAAGSWGPYSTRDYTISSLNANTQYYARQWATNAAGESVQGYNHTATTPLPTVPVQYGQALVPFGDMSNSQYCPFYFSGGVNFHYNASVTNNQYVYGASMMSSTSYPSPPCYNVSGNYSGNQWRYSGLSLRNCYCNAQAGGSYTMYGAIQASGYADSTRSATQSCSN
jgi:hypothetical protein